MKKGTIRSVPKGVRSSGLSISCTSFTPGKNGIHYPDTYTLVRNHPAMNMNFTIGDFEKLEILSEELTEYVKTAKKGGQI